MAIILCEQQTLFAPHYTNFDKVVAVSTDTEGGSTDLHLPDTVDGLIAIIAIAATEVGIMDPNDCPSIVDLWFELVDAGYTEDEAFDLVELVMGEQRNLFDPEAVNDTQRGYINHIRSEHE